MFELKKIGFVKRASAWLLDAILLAVLTTGVMWIVSLICDFDGAQHLASSYYTEWEDFRADYMGEVAPYYGFTYEETEDGYTVQKDGQSATLDDVLVRLRDSKGEDEATKEAYAAFQALTPAETVNAQYRYVYSLLFMMVSIGLAVSYLLLEFVVPLILGNGQTVGKKVFGICVVRPDCVKMASVALFARSILGKFAIETMFPILLIFLFFFGGLGLLAIILLAALFILNLVLFFATRNHTPIHDILAFTAVADMKVQMIFDSEEELAAKKASAQKQFIEQQKNV